MVADVLSKLGSKRALVLAGVFVQALNSPTVKIEEEPPTKPNLVLALGQEVLVTDQDWRAPILDFIINNKSYPKVKEYERLARRAANYVIIGTELFRQLASSGTLSKCISQHDGVRLLGEIHSRICGNHAEASTLVGKAFRSGIYWPTPRSSSDDALGASSSPRSSTSRLRPCRRSLHPGNLPAGDSTRWDCSRRHKAASPTYLSVSTS